MADPTSAHNRVGRFRKMTYLLLVSVVLSITVAWIRGGKLGQLGDITFRWWWAVPLVALAQSIVVRFAYSPRQMQVWHPRPTVMIVSYVALWAIVWRNRRLPGMWIVLVGVTFNLLAIAANGGYMPITADALAQISAGSTAYQMPVGSVIAGSKDILVSRQQAYFWMLGDVLVIPKPFPWPTAMSVGDIMLSVGVFWLVVRTMRPSPNSSSLSNGC